jgi:hypothetical protein
MNKLLTIYHLSLAIFQGKGFRDVISILFDLYPTQISGVLWQYDMMVTAKRSEEIYNPVDRTFTEKYWV